MADELDEGILGRHRELLEERIDPDSGLLDVLLADNTLSRGEIREIRAKDPYHKRNAAILDFIIEKRQCNRLGIALKENGQVHLMNYLIADAKFRSEFKEDWPLTEKELSILNTNQQYLVDNIDLDDLIGRLYSKDVINKRQRNTILSKQTCHERNEVFLDILSRRNIKDFRKTICCLHDSNQSHIAEILEEGGVVVKVHAEGLDDKFEEAIIAAYQRILKDKTPEGRRLILERISLDVISLEKGESIVLYVYCKTVIQLFHLRNMQIKEALKFAVHYLFLAIGSLETSQMPLEFHLLLFNSQIGGITATLSEDEFDRCRSYFPGSIKLRAVSNFSPKEMSYTQKNELKDILQSKKCSLNDKGSTFADKAISIIRGIKKGIFWKIAGEEKENAESEKKDEDMTLSFRNGDRMETIPPADIGDTINWWKVIHAESGKIGYIPRSLVVVDNELLLNQKYKTLAKTNQAANLKEVASKTSMSNLPFELLDSILLKSYLMRVLGEKKSTDHHAISQMASVNFCCFQTIKRRTFKKEVRRRLVVLYRRKEKIFSIYRSNRQYLEENIRLKGLVNRLKSSDCLTNVQRASLYRQNLAVGKNSFKRIGYLISDVLKKIETVHSVFRRDLWDTKQYLIGEVIENGGVAVKVETNFRSAETSVKAPNQNLKFAKGINEIQDKRKASSHQIEELMAKLKQEELEILSSGQDGDIIVVWIWCKTKNALEKLQTLNKSKHVIEVFSELFRNLSYSSDERIPVMIKPNVNIDFEQFEKTVVFFSTIANYTSRLRLEDGALRYDEDVVWGVTKLRNKIHVLLRSSDPNCAILVFEDQIPYRLLERIRIIRIEDPRDIASIETENSLYVLDLGSCIWKIKEYGDEREKKEKMIKWLELRDYSDYGPETLSMTKDGQLLLAGRRKNDSFWILRIFGEEESEEADLPISIPLPEDIQNPIHTVETSRGNFIILHPIIKSKKEEESGSAGVRRELEKWMKKRKELMEEWVSVWVVSEVSRNGKTILRQFFPKNEEQKLSLSYLVGEGLSGHLAVDTLDRVFLADSENARVILFDSNLQWNGILTPTEEDEKEERKIRGPRRLFYDDETKRLIIGGEKEVFIYTLKRK